jgi:hypothetical protein
LILSRIDSGPDGLRQTAVSDQKGRQTDEGEEVPGLAFVATVQGGGIRRARTPSSPRPSGDGPASQSVKADAVVGLDSRGFDGGKLVNGRKRHVVVDSACCWA